MATVQDRASSSGQVLDRVALSADAFAHEGIVTPEGIRLAFHTAGIGSRSVAFLIDAMARAMVFYMVTTLFAVVGLVGRATETIAVVSMLIAGFVVFFGYPIAFEVFNRGRTLGKMALGLRVVTVEGAPVRFRHAAIRSGFELVDFYLAVGFVGMTSAILSRRQQRLGDLVAGTMVVRERTASVSATAYTFVPPPGWEAFTAQLDSSRLSRDMHVAVRTFLVRYPDMAHEHRAAMAVDLAGQVAGALGVQLSAPASALDFLISVTSAYQRSQSTDIVPDGRRHGDGAPPPVLPPDQLEPTWGRTSGDRVAARV